MVKRKQPIALWVKSNSPPKRIKPKVGKDFSLKELQGYVGGTIDIAALPSGKVLVVNDNGKMEGLPMNPHATAVWQTEFPIEKYPHNNDGLIVGDVVICDKAFIK